MVVIRVVYAVVVYIVVIYAVVVYVVVVCVVIYAYDSFCTELCVRLPLSRWRVIYTDDVELLSRCRIACRAAMQLIIELFVELFVEPLQNRL